LTIIVLKAFTDKEDPNIIKVCILK
jgi:hypothetical protein